MSTQSQKGSPCGCMGKRMSFGDSVAAERTERQTHR